MPRRVHLREQQSERQPPERLVCHVDAGAMKSLNVEQGQEQCLTVVGRVDAVVVHLPARRAWLSKLVVKQIVQVILADEQDECVWGADDDARKPASRLYVNALQQRIKILEAALKGRGGEVPQADAQDEEEDDEPEHDGLASTMLHLRVRI